MIFPHRFISSLSLLAVTVGISLFHISSSAQNILWSENFSGINGPLIGTTVWNGVENLPNNGSLRNPLLVANDKSLGFDFPAAHKHPVGFYSSGGAVYASLPITDKYFLTGNLVDFGTIADRAGNTSVFVETGIAADHSLSRRGWEIRLVRWDDGRAHNSIQIFTPDGTQVVNVYLSAAPTSPILIPFSFRRDGNAIQIRVGDCTDPHIFDTTESWNSEFNKLMLQHTIRDYGSDSTRTGWANLLMTDLNTTGGQTFESWLKLHLTPDELTDPASAAPEASPGGDGLTNLLKYALGLAPKQFIPASERPAGLLVGNHLQITFTPDLNVTDVNLAVEVSSDLTNWFSGPDYVETVEVATSSGTVVIRDLITSTEADRRFIRLHASRK